MTVLLDTNVVSELRKPRADEHVVTWALDMAETSAFLSVVTVREIETGILLVERRDPQRGSVLRAWFEETVLVEYGDRILPVDVAVARRSATLHVPDPRPERDALIAATGLVHGLTVATRNVADFAPMGVRVVNPWEAETNP